MPTALSVFWASVGGGGHLTPLLHRTSPVLSLGTDCVKNVEVLRVKGPIIM